MIEDIAQPLEPDYGFIVYDGFDNVIRNHEIREAWVGVCMTLVISSTPETSS